MRAALYEAGSTDLTIGDVDIDDPAPGRVRVRVHHCGICHSDYTALHSTYGASPSVLGHEAAGVVDAVGEGVTMVAPGDKVVLTPDRAVRPLLLVPARPARVLREQRRGARRRVPRRFDRPVARRPAGVPRPRRRRLRRVRDVQRDRRGEGPRRHAARDRCVIGCAVQTGVGAVLNTAKVEPGATVLVLGLGGIGLSVVQGARAAGAAQIIASDPLDWRRDAAATMGATTVLDPNADDVLAATRDLTAWVPTTRSSARASPPSPRSASRRPGPAARPCSSARRRSRASSCSTRWCCSASARRSSWAASSAAATRCATSPAWSPCGAPASSTSRPSSPPAAARRHQRRLHRPRRRRRHPHGHRPGLRPRRARVAALGGAQTPGVHFLLQQVKRMPSGLGESPDRRWPGVVPLVIMGGINYLGAREPTAASRVVDPVRSRGRR